jgi:transcriptional regulator with XRE-family HTH domain
MTIGERISERRRVRGLSQRQVAEALGISVQAVSSWEADKAQPKTNRLGALAVILGVTPGWLSGTTDKQRPPFPINDRDSNDVPVVHIDHAILHLIRGYELPADQVIDRIRPTKPAMGLIIAVEASGNEIEKFGFQRGDYLIFDAGVFPLKGDVILLMGLSKDSSGQYGEFVSSIAICPDSDAEPNIAHERGGRLGTLVERRTFRQPRIDDETQQN